VQTPKTLRIEAGDEWIEIRHVDELSWADQENYDSAIDEVREQADMASRDPVTGLRRTVLSEDGVTMVPAVPNVAALITPAWSKARRDQTITSLLVAWSYDMPLEITPEAKARISQIMSQKLADAVKPHFEALSSPGPKETTATSNGSASSSKARRATTRQD
jgi:hypothetical protein